MTTSIRPTTWMLPGSRTTPRARGSGGAKRILRSSIPRRQSPPPASLVEAAFRRNSQ
jgi:hypothetical protein